MDVRANETTLYAELAGEGPPVVFVHGSWGDHHNWDLVAPEVAASHRSVTYDRRGHSQSEATPGPGSVREDAADLGALIEALDLAPVHLVGNSFGAVISLHLAAARPDLIRSLFVHEPPLVDLLAREEDLQPIVGPFNERAAAVVELLRAGAMEQGARQFVDTIAFGPGAWDQMPAPAQATFVGNAPTWLDEMQEPGGLDFDLSSLHGFDRPALLSQGDQSPPMFEPIVDRVSAAIRTATRHTFVGAGHVPHMSHSADYIKTLVAFLTSHA